MLDMGKKGVALPINNFDDLDNELNEVLVRVLSAMLKIKDRVVLIDLAQWVELYEDLRNKTEIKEFLNEVKDT
jgi:archaellum biogenesis ATPase FlaH